MKTNTFAVGSLLLASCFLVAPIRQKDFGQLIESIEIRNGTLSTIDLDPAACGTTEIWEDQGGAWACIATPNGAGTSGDSVRVEDGDNTGAFTSMANMDMDDSGDINFTRAAGPPDVLTVFVRADAVALTTDTTGGYAASVSEAGPATTATALAANGANCATAGQFPDGVDASGVVESCSYPGASARMWQNEVPNVAGLHAATPDTCRCHLHAFPVGILDLDVVRVSVPGTDANDHVELGVYSEDGATRYFQAQVDVATGNYLNVANTIGAPSVMVPANYGVCLAIDNTTPSATFRANNSGLTLREGAMEFTQACAGGVIPATLTAPVFTFVTPAAGDHDLWWQMVDN